MRFFKTGRGAGSVSLDLSDPFVLVSEQPRESDDLISRCRRGDREAWRALYHRYHDDVARIVTSFAPSFQERDDIVQEAFVQVFRSIQGFKGRSAFTTWLYRVSVNCALQYLRKRKASAMPLDEHQHADGHPGASPAAEAERRERWRMIQQVMGEIGMKKRTVLILHHIHGFKTEQIAEIIDCSAATVRTRLHYGRQEFIRHWRAIAGDSL